MDSADGDNAVVSKVVLGNSSEMTTISLHFFGDSGSNDDDLTIQIIEIMREEYGMFVWPCSVILAEYVWQHKSRFSATSVLEGPLYLDLWQRRWGLMLHSPTMLIEWRCFRTFRKFVT